jgi:hypothetical protein
VSGSNQEIGSGSNQEIGSDSNQEIGSGSNQEIGSGFNFHSTVIIHLDQCVCFNIFKFFNVQ